MPLGLRLLSKCISPESPVAYFGVFEFLCVTDSSQSIPSEGERCGPANLREKEGDSALNLKTVRNESPAFNANASSRAVLRCNVDIFTSSRKMDKQRLNPPRAINYHKTVFKKRFFVLPEFQLIGFPFRNWGGPGPFLIT